ncbi:MAG: 50S ribosomal protein L25 [Myxococcales bacterium]|nr:50S ribosomal protein L25 [Myxococcales bacterium]
MEAQTLSAEVRTKSGKGPARQLRAKGLIPAIFYGPGTETVKLAVSPAKLERMLTGDYGRNQLIELDYEGTKAFALVKELAVDPVHREILHADFYAVSKERTVEATVPFQVRGRAIGVQKGGQIRKLFRELPVRALPQNVPAAITLDVGPLDLGAEVKVADLALDEGVEVTFPARRRVLFIEYKEAKAKEGEEAATPAPAGKKK